MSADNEQAKTREDHKKAKQAAPQKEAAPEPQANKRVRIRIIPIWLRLVLLVISVFICIIAGATVGYGMLGGGNVGDVFKESTWTHIIDLVDKE